MKKEGTNEQEAPTGPVTKAEAIQRIFRSVDHQSASLEQVAMGSIDMTRYKRVLANVLALDDKLWLCTPSSIMRTIRHSFELQLELGSALHHASMLPFKSKTSNQLEAQLVIEYRGFIHIITRDGRFKSVVAEAVYEADMKGEGGGYFDYDQGTGHYLKHKKSLAKDRGDIIGAYVIFFALDGSYTFHFMTWQEIEDIRAKAPSPNSPAWSKNTAEMYCKTAIKQGAKRIPQSPQLANALKLDNAVETENFEDAVIDVEPVTYSEEATGDKVEETLKKEQAAAPEGQAPKAGAPKFSDVAKRFSLQTEETTKLIKFGVGVLPEVVLTFDSAIAANIELGRYFPNFETWEEMKAALDKDIASRAKSTPTK